MSNKERDWLEIFRFGSPTDSLDFSKDLNIDSINSDLGSGQTPLGVAIEFKNNEMVRWLLANGADVNFYIKDSCGDPPVKIAADIRNFDLVKNLAILGADLLAPGWMGLSALDRLIQYASEP
jgi:hypothetical protein